MSRGRNRRTRVLGELGALEPVSGLLKSLSCIPRAVGSSECVFKPLRNRIRFSVVKRSFWPKVLNRMEGGKRSKGKEELT